MKKEAEKWEQERNMKDKEIETYRSMYEEADNKYVEAEKRINKMDKREYVEKENKSGGKEGKQERLGEIYLRSKSLRIDEEKMDIVEEFPQTRRDLDDKRWPAIRPPILGKSRILTLPGKIKTPQRLVRGQEEPGDETSPRIEIPTMRTSLKRSLRMYDEPGKEEKKRPISKSEEEIDKINGQIRALEEEKKRIKEGRTIGSGKPRIISDIQIIPPRDMRQDIMPQEQQQDEA